jgi:NAD(P)-dependent dehydrogenase (short-subunit alcohol dehydrogenase family)
MQDVQGKVAVITGGASGIGLAMARRFAAEGMKVLLADIEEGALDDAAAALRADGADVRTGCDVSKEVT